MSRFWNRAWTCAAVLTLASGIECGMRADRSLQVGAYYRELGVEMRGMNPVERSFVSLLLAAGQKRQKHKRQTHASLPPVRAYGNS